MRARGAFAAEHIFTALAMSPARMHFCIVARNTSLLIADPNRYSARSTITPTSMMDQKRMMYIPQPPSLKCFHAAAIEPSSVRVDRQRAWRPLLIEGTGLRRRASCERAFDLERCRPCTRERH